MPSTLYLDPTTWDLCLDADGNIARADAPYATLQDVASACRLFLGELFYDTSRGIRFFENGQPVSILKAQMVTAAKAVPGVADAIVFLSAINPASRAVTGQIQVTMKDGSVQTVTL